MNSRSLHSTHMCAAQEAQGLVTHSLARSRGTGLPLAAHEVGVGVGVGALGPLKHLLVSLTHPLVSLCPPCAWGGVSAHVPWQRRERAARGGGLTAHKGGTH